MDPATLSMMMAAGKMVAPMLLGMGGGKPQASQLPPLPSEKRPVLSGLLAAPMR